MYRKSFISVLWTNQPNPGLFSLLLKATKKKKKKKKVNLVTCSFLLLLSLTPKNNLGADFSQEKPSPPQLTCGGVRLCAHFRKKVIVCAQMRGTKPS